MKYGIREICDVVLKAKSTIKIGNKTFYKGEPVIYFDSLKTSTLEGAATTVYAQGGRGNSRLVAWEGERTLTFTMEDALISTEGFMILSGAGLVQASKPTTTEEVEINKSVTALPGTDGKIQLPEDELVTGTEVLATIYKADGSVDYDDATTFANLSIPETGIEKVIFTYTTKKQVGSNGKTIYVHTTETTTINSVDSSGAFAIINLKKKPSEHNAAKIYVMVLEDGEPITEPYIATYAGEDTSNGDKEYRIEIKDLNAYTNLDGKTVAEGYTVNSNYHKFAEGQTVLVDFYVEKESGAQQIEIEAGKFGGNYYLEASTLFRDAATGDDMPAEFIIPNCKIQSNFTFTMASSGDPSTFTFTMDAFPDYTKFDGTKKVLAAIQVITDEEVDGLGANRIATNAI